MQRLTKGTLQHVVASPLKVGECLFHPRSPAVFRSGAAPLLSVRGGAALSVTTCVFVEHSDAFQLK